MRPLEPTESEEIIPRGGMQLAAYILVVFALVAVYSNVQEARRASMESVTIAPAAPTQTPSPSPATP